MREVVVEHRVNYLCFFFFSYLNVYSLQKILIMVVSCLCVPFARKVVLVVKFYMQTYRKLNNCYWKLHNDLCVGVTMCPMVPP